MQSIWICPKCQQPLSSDSGALACANGHNYDLAKEGYVNLLPSGKKLAATVGDSASMLVARRSFLSAGYYSGLLERLIQLVMAETPRVVYETGSGEGYYIAGISEALPDAVCLGTDIAKDGIRMAAKRYPHVGFAVADTYGSLPLADQAVDVMLDVFAPRNPGEFNRVLKTTGKLIVVIPAADHLSALRAREAMIGIQEDKKQAVVQALEGEFVLYASETLVLPLDLDGMAVQNLIGMTPSARFQTAGEQSYLPIATSAIFEIMTFERLS